MKHYYVNNLQTSNPGLHHEVHSSDCYLINTIKSKTYLGVFYSGIIAVAEAKRIYRDADGCKHCCPEAHKG